MATGTFSKNKAIQNAFGADSSFLSIPNIAIRGFYFIGNIEQQNEALSVMTSSLIENKNYAELLEYLFSLLEVEASVRFGFVNGNIELSICYSEDFTKINRTIVLGDKDSLMEDYYNSIKDSFGRYAIYSIGNQSSVVNLFFDTFKKVDLKTIVKVKDKIVLFKKMENHLSQKEERLLLDLAKKYCMNSIEVSKEGFFDRFWRF